MFCRFAVQFGYDNCEANTGFLSQFTRRKGLVSKRAAGESASVEKEATEDYIIHTLQPLLDRYAADDIYNVDETGLFFPTIAL